MPFHYAVRIHFPRTLACPMHCLPIRISLYITSPDGCIDCILFSYALYFIYAVGPIAKRLAVQVHQLEARRYLRSR